MKRCQCCGTQCEDQQATCPQCGEASWAGTARVAQPEPAAIIDPPAEVVAEEPEASPAPPVQQPQRPPQYQQNKHNKGRR